MTPVDTFTAWTYCLLVLGAPFIMSIMIIWGDHTTWACKRAFWAVQDFYLIRFKGWTKQQCAEL